MLQGQIDMHILHMCAGYALSKVKPTCAAVDADAMWVCVRVLQAMRRSDSFDSVKSAQSFISANSAEREGSGAGQVPPYAGGGGGRCTYVHTKYRL
jgi:hypothetical protein